MASRIERIFAVTSRQPLRVHRPMRLASSGLYGYLRSRACESGENLIFDVDRLWSVDPPCIKAENPFMLVVYFLHRSPPYWVQPATQTHIDTLHNTLTS
ncbi:hypothetical protein HRG_012984 [Hirsutella rhossiliensis]